MYCKHSKRACYCPQEVSTESSHEIRWHMPKHRGADSRSPHPTVGNANRAESWSRNVAHMRRYSEIQIRYGHGDGEATKRSQASDAKASATTSDARDQSTDDHTEAPADVCRA